MKVVLTFLSTLAGLSHALPGLPWHGPAPSCSTTTVEVTIPTRIYTYTTTPISTVYASGAEDLGTWTYTLRIPSTSTIATVTSTETTCEGSTVHPPSALATQWTSAQKRHVRPPGAVHSAATTSACTVTSTITTSVGASYDIVTGTSTSTFTQYTAYSQATVTITTSTGTTYVVASATATNEACPSNTTTTVIRDTRCAPGAMVSAAGGTNNTQWGLEYKSDVPGSGAAYSTVADDASACCQLCADRDDICAGSAWDVRTGACTLEFAVNPSNGVPDCGESLLAYYDAGPDFPMAPGAGWWVANVCGGAAFGGAGPDDGT